jgi:uncharacterized protein YeaO (DUF488 family)
MILYTIQLAQWRKAKAQGIPILDSIVRSGDAVFAPTWDMVSKIKNDSLTDVQYTALYRELMIKSIKENPDRWRQVMSMEMVAIGCYCKAGEFCHRHLLAEILHRLCTHNGVECLLNGELT